MQELSENRGAFMLAPICYGRNPPQPMYSNPGTPGSQLLNVTTTVFSAVVLSDVFFNSIIAY